MIATFEQLLIEKFIRDRERGELVWKDKEGNIIPIKNLSDEHLINIINSFNKKLEETTNIKSSSLNFY